MLLTLDIGNSQIFGGLFLDGQIKLRFRHASRQYTASDEFGLFLRQVLRENGFDCTEVRDIVICSVVPELNHAINSACIKYFDIRPMMLQAGLKIGLNLCVKNSQEIGGDFIAAMMAAVDKIPNKPLMVVDFGTATTVCVVSRHREYLGGVIAPGLRLCMEALEQHTSKLPTVEIKVPSVIMGGNNIENIQSGLYYSALGLLKEIKDRLQADIFKQEDDLTMVGTGGFVRLFENANVFDVIEPDLVLYGLYRLWKLNHNRIK